MDKRLALEVNEARYNMFCYDSKCELAMPPNRDSLIKHAQRANYQAAIYKRSLESNPMYPSPTEHGWRITNGEISLIWGDLPPAPDIVLELSNCSARCKRSNCTDEGKCTCLQNKLPCTDLCKCARRNCSNVTGHADESDYGSECDSDSETDV